MSTTLGLRLPLLIQARCANGGISDRVDHVTLTSFLDQPLQQLLPADLPWAAPDAQAPEVHVVPGNLRGTLKAVVPGQGSDTEIGPMMGGSHLPPLPGLTGEPVPLHDRYESPELYQRLSH